MSFNEQIVFQRRKSNQLNALGSCVNMYNKMIHRIIHGNW